MKKDVLPEDFAKDIQLLFSRAGMSGAKYREFPRHEALAGTGSPSAGAATPATESRVALPLERILEPATSVAATLPPPRPRETSAAPLHPSPSYPSLERIFSGNENHASPGAAIRSGLRLAMLSLAGGVGKTTLAVTLARILSGMRNQVIIADCGFHPSAAQHLGSQGQRLGLLQFFFSPSSSAPTPIAVFRTSPGDGPGKDLQDLVEQVDGSETTMLLDIPTLHDAKPGGTLAYASHALVPVTPNMHSVAGVAHLQAMLAASEGPTAHYVINRFNESRALHREVRSRLYELLGASLLPFVIHEEPAIEEAAAYGMTVVDAFPDSTAVHEFAALAEWSRTLSASPWKQRNEVKQEKEGTV